MNPHSEALRQLCADTKCHINLARQLRYEVRLPDPCLSACMSCSQIMSIGNLYTDRTQAATDRLCTITGTLSSVHAAVTGILMHLVPNADDAQVCVAQLFMCLLTVT